MRDNTATGGSRKNIAAHYDLGNDFYKLWLDETLSYSAALFAHPEEPLKEAQQRKVSRLLDQLNLNAGQHLLEIGCGWGELMQQSLDRQVSVTALTLSSEQQRLVQERLSADIARGRASVLLQDYRHHQGQYDAIVSVEMFEAVGEKWWSVYFEQVATLLKPQGRFAMQSISIHPDRFDRYKAHPDFIQRFIFPGGMLPTTDKLTQLAQQAGLTLLDRLDFGRDYALTLRRWQQAFEKQRTAIQNLGIDDVFYRRWHYYLAYCEAGFMSGSIDVHQLTFVKAR
jgi:cyclopropane-fatty-acyl-phospholipid synthase